MTVDGGFWSALEGPPTGAKKAADGCGGRTADGGTVLLGGIKRLREGRTERGVPILSKVPWVSRLFKNVGIGREAQSLMMMVTPRIIIQEEEEAKLGIEIPEQ